MIDQLFLTIRTALRCLLGCFIAYMIFRAIGVMAGRSTSLVISATLHAFADVKVVLPSLIAAAACAGWYTERRLRHKSTAHMAGRIEKFEVGLDPKRTSSKLTRHGRTNPADKEA
jgi:hypothetical protein